MKNIGLIFAFLMCSGTGKAQESNTYFSRLKSDQITSTPHLLWKQFGPGMAGYCEELWCHPSKPNILFLGPDMHVSYGSWDAGESWQTIKNCDGTGYDLERVIQMDFSRQNPSFGLALDRDGLINRTDDLGKTWQVITDLGKCHSELAVDPSNDQNWYVGAGDFFNVKDNHRSQKHPHGIILPRSEYGHLWKSTNQGKDWRKITNGLPEKVDIGRIVVDPRDSQVIVAATGHGLYRSDDQGESWRKIGRGLPNNLPRDLVSHYDSKTKSYTLFLVEQSCYMADADGSIQVKGGVFKSMDGGLNWTNISGNLALDLTQIHSPATSSYYYRAMAYWFGCTSAEAKKKYPTLPKQIFSVFNRIRVNPHNPQEIYLAQNIKHDFAFPPGEVWKTKDGGKTWIACARVGAYWESGKDLNYWKSRNNPVGMNMKFGHLHESLASKESFAGNRFLEVDAQGDLFICVDQQMLRSQDAGDSWQQIDDRESSPGSNIWIGRGNSDLPGRYMLLETGVKDRHLYCSGEHGLWESANLAPHELENSPIGVIQLDGQNQHHTGAYSISTVAVHPHDPNTIFTLVFRQRHRGYLRKSTDGGKTWTNVSKPINYHHKQDWAYHVFQHSLSIDPINPDNMYFTTIAQPISEVGDGGKKDFDEYGFYRTKDAGVTWEICNHGLPENSSINRICLDPKNPKKIYAALNKCKQANGGLYISNNQGDDWQAIHIPKVITSVNHVFVDRNNGDLLISCGHKGGQPEEGGVYRSKDQGKTWNKIFDMPYIWQTETSPVNPKIITVSSAGKRKWGKTGYEIKNPGAYISFDGGKSWTKANQGLGQPDKITDFKPDPYHENLFWCALWGSGWYKGIWKP